MTKSLTEKWKDGELPEDTYYVEFLCGRYRTYEFNRLEGFGFDNDLAYIKEVLEPVPSYEEWKRFQEQLKEANEVIKKYAKGTFKVKVPTYQGTCYGTNIITGLPDKEDLYEGYHYEDVPMANNTDTANKYLKKWGVK